MKINATVYFDSTSDFKNPGWVCETDEDGHPQYQLDAKRRNASDKTLRAEAKAFADGDIEIRRH